MSVTGMAWLIGAAFAADAEHELAGAAAVFPHIGLSALLAEVFIEIDAAFGRVFVATFVWTCGAVVLAWLATLANIAGVDLEEAMDRKYGGGCPKCHANPCRCGTAKP